VKDPRRRPQRAAPVPCQRATVPCTWIHLPHGKTPAPIIAGKSSQPDILHSNSGPHPGSSRRGNVSPRKGSTFRQHNLRARNKKASRSLPRNAFHYASGSFAIRLKNCTRLRMRHPPHSHLLLNSCPRQVPADSCKETWLPVWPRTFPCPVHPLFVLLCPAGPSWVHPVDSRQSITGFRPVWPLLRHVRA